MPLLLVMVHKQICKHWAASLSLYNKIQEVDKHKNTKQISHETDSYRQLFVTKIRVTVIIRILRMLKK